MPIQRMLTVFGVETAKPPAGLASPSVGSRHPEDAEADASCKEIIEKAFLSKSPSQVQLKLLGKGCGFGFLSGPYCSYATKDGVHVMFSGEVSDWPGINMVAAAHDAFISNVKPAEDDDAHWLLDFYSSFRDTETSQDDGQILREALESLCTIRGSFAFVIYDSILHRLLAARDADGVQPLYWGSTEEGQLMFGSAIDDLDLCQPTATMFPAGTLFASLRHNIAYNPGPEGWVIAGEDYPGELLSFIKADEAHWKSVKAIPRITSKGCVTGAVYKVSSQPDMNHVAV